MLSIFFTLNESILLVVLGSTIANSTFAGSPEVISSAVARSIL
ncbi:hypothetical protein ES705_36131 [subsurface metagenome]